MVDYSFYLDTYEGKKIKNETDFCEFAKKAELYINSVISQKHTEKDIAEAVCAVADVMFSHQDSLGVKSEKVDGISVTYDGDRTERLMYNTLKLYVPSRLLYRGL